MALVGVGRGHPDVDHGEVGTVFVHRIEERAGVTHRRDHGDPDVAEQPHQTVAQQHRVVGDHDPQGVGVSHGTGPRRPTWSVRPQAT